MQSITTRTAWTPPLSSTPHLKLQSAKPTKLSPTTTTTTSTTTIKTHTVKFKTTQKNNNHHYFNNSNGNSGDVEDSETTKCPLPPPSVKSITSTSNPFVKHCVKLLRSRNYRHYHASTLVLGATTIREIYQFQESLEEKTVETDCLLLLDEARVPEMEGLVDSSARTLRVSALVMKKISQIQSTESIDAVALMRFPTSYYIVNDNQKGADCRKWFPSPHRILVLEGIQDPGNMGTLLRSAVAFRWGGVFLLPGCCDPFSGKAMRAARGASFQLPIVYGSWYDLQSLKDTFQMKMLAGHPDANEASNQVSRLCQELADSLSSIPLCLVLGNEAQGLMEKTQRECELVSIPMAGAFESLNVAVAGGIFLYMLQPSNHR